jgi:hypothetical protein
MAQYWIDFTTLSDLSDFTVINAKSASLVDDGSGTQVLRVTSFGVINENSAVVYDPAGSSVGDCEIISKFRYSVYPADISNRTFGIHGRIVGSTSADLGMYNYGVRGSDRGSLFYAPAGTSSETLTQPRHRVDNLNAAWWGMTITGYVFDVWNWEGTLTAADKPATPSGSSTDPNSRIATGSVGVGEAGVLTVDEYCDYYILAIGTGGDAAPTGPVGGTIPTLSAPGVTDLGSTSVRPQITLTF